MRSLNSLKSYELVIAMNIKIRQGNIVIIKQILAESNKPVALLTSLACRAFCQESNRSLTIIDMVTRVIIIKGIPMLKIVLNLNSKTITVSKSNNSNACKNMFPTKTQVRTTTSVTVVILKLQQRFTCSGRNTHINRSTDIITSTHVENIRHVSKITKTNRHCNPCSNHNASIFSRNETVTKHMSVTARTQKRSLVVLARGCDVGDVITRTIIVFPGQQRTIHNKPMAILKVSISNILVTVCYPKRLRMIFDSVSYCRIHAFNVIIVMMFHYIYQKHLELCSFTVHRFYSGLFIVVNVNVCFNGFYVPAKINGFGEIFNQ